MNVDELTAAFAAEPARAEGLTENLVCALQAAVPLRIDDLRSWTAKRREAEAAWLTELRRGGASGAELLYGPGGDGRPAGQLAVFARALAAQAYVEGGVTFAGLHWCTAPHVGCTSRPHWTHLGGPPDAALG